MMPSMRPFVALMTVAAFCASCGREAPEETQSETIVPVTTEPARLDTIRASIRATGLVEPAPGADIVVIAPESARIAEIPKAEGDTVHRGDLLVRFEIPTITADVDAKRAEIDRATARLENARANQVRAKDLFERGIAARKEVEDAAREFADGQAGLAQAKAALSAAEQLSRRTVVRALFDGVVAKRSHNPGDLVEASASDPVLRVIDPQRLEVHALVPIGDVARLKAGASARIAELPDAVVLKVVSRPAAVEQGTAAVPVRLSFATPTSYPVGTPVQVTIDAEEHRDVVVVPAAALVREGEETAVFIAVENKAQRRPVVIGLASDKDIEIKSGVKAGEPVITHGQAGLPDGAPITVEKPGK
jgi:RND family efflux transporter MFP subunit